MACSLAPGSRADQRAGQPSPHRSPPHVGLWRCRGEVTPPWLGPGTVELVSLGIQEAPVGRTAWEGELCPRGDRFSQGALGSSARGLLGRGSVGPHDSAPLRGDPAPSLCGDFTRTPGPASSVARAEIGWCTATGGTVLGERHIQAVPGCSWTSPGSPTLASLLPGMRRRWPRAVLLSWQEEEGLSPLPWPEVCPTARSCLGSLALWPGTWTVSRIPRLMLAGMRRTPGRAPADMAHADGTIDGPIVTLVPLTLHNTSVNGSNSGTCEPLEGSARGMFRPNGRVLEKLS